MFYAAEYAANSGVHHLTEEECNGWGFGVWGWPVHHQAQLPLGDPRSLFMPQRWVKTGKPHQDQLSLRPSILSLRLIKFKYPSSVTLFHTVPCEYLQLSKCTWSVIELPLDGSKEQHCPLEWVIAVLVSCRSPTGGLEPRAFMLSWWSDYCLYDFSSLRMLFLLNQTKSYHSLWSERDRGRSAVSMKV